MNLAGLLACSILDTFPFLYEKQWLGDFEDTFGAYSSGVCSGFSPDSLFTHLLKNRGDEHQNRQQRYGGFLNMQATFIEITEITTKRNYPYCCLGNVKCRMIHPQMPATIVPNNTPNFA